MLAPAAGAASAAPATKPPTLELVRMAPFTARGLHFRARERVRLVLTVPSGRLVRRVLADRLGSFRIRIVGLAVDRCSGFGLVAHGARGSTAVLKIRPACPPA